MKFIKDTHGSYINADKIIALTVGKSPNKFYIKAHTELENLKGFVLAEFDTETEARYWLDKLIEQIEDRRHKSNCCHQADNEPLVPAVYSDEYFKPDTVNSYKFVDFKPTWGVLQC